MQLIPALLFLQSGLSAKQPGYFFPVFLGLLIAGGIAWLIAAVLGFARARAFGASTRWFSFAAVCLLIYHIQFLLLGFIAVMGAQQNDFDSVLGFARARAFGPSARWFSFAAVCLLLFHIQIIAVGFGMVTNDTSLAFSILTFLNLFVILGAVCAIMGFVRLTSPR